MHQIYTHYQRLILVLGLIGVSSSIFGQAIVIEYDYLKPNQAQWHYENDTTPHLDRKIRVNKDIPIKIQLQNFNTDALQSELVVRKGQSVDSLITTGITSFFGMVASFAVPMLPAGLDLTKLMAPKSRGDVRGTATLLYAPMQVDLENASLLSNSSTTDLDAAIRERLNQINKWRSVRDQLKALHYNTSLSKAELQQRCQEVLNQLTPTAPALFNNETQARQLLGQMALENAQYLKYALTLLEQKAGNTSATPPPTTRGETTPTGFNDFLLAEAIKQHRKNIPDDLGDQLATTLNESLVHYQSVTKNTFTASLNATVDRNSEALILQFYDNSTPASSTDKRKVVRSDKFTVIQPGQWQLATSFGLSFTHFSQRIQSYGIVNGKVAATDLESFTPTLAGYVQLFRRTTNFVRYGVHLGVGIPLAEARGVGFQFGPSLAFGRQNAISVNAGLFTGRAPRLGGGLAVGDAFTSTTLPTINRYEWGYHIGLSFQLGLRR